MATPEGTPAPDFGEPWAQERGHLAGFIMDRDGHDVMLPGGFSADDDERLASRSVACVNALAGIADPEAWVREARELLREVADGPPSFALARRIRAFLEAKP